ncbi:MAG TPA: sigma-70 family RNA polymerase sigma factor [Bacteroidetes bacterium]|nr:sigma-70 family RNA polymerase sigma factor [Bacteroidota bacterium]
MVEAFLDGDHSGIELLIRRYRNKVYTYILLLVKNQELAEDIFQDTFIKVIRSLNQGKYQENGRFLSWVMRIAHNLVIDHFRKEKQMKVVSNDNYETDLFNSRKLADGTVEDMLVGDQITREVRMLIDYLPDEQKEVVIMRHYAGLSFKEIAEQTNVSINTALGRMRYALINLRKMIRERNLNLTSY